MLLPKTAITTTAPSMRALPSITELGRILGTIARREATLSLVPAEIEKERLTRLTEEQGRQTATNLLFLQMDALREVVSTLPAQSLSDCVVQVNVASAMAAMITNNKVKKPELQRLAVAVERIMISILPVLAVLAGLDPVEFALDNVISLHDGYFPELAR